MYNPEQESALYFVPGLMAIILIMISALLTSLTLTREKETGTMEQLLVSPIRPWEVVIGKIVPYIVIAALDGVLILVVGRIFFGVTISGSALFLAASGVIYIVTSLALGLIFSTFARTQQQAMMMTLPATMMPTVILSGFIFPLRSMPLFLQGVSRIIPATYFLQLIRGIVLKGVGPVALWQPLAGLAGLGIVFLTVSIVKFRTKL
ncbi:MAG: ABC transporter permease subunit [Chitinivibrionales bacterium]|nr:ABC transporter permease subunit [Chitinivibrionales bacterium]